MTDHAGHQAAFILIDSVVAFIPGAPVGRHNPMNIAVQRLNDIDGMVVIKSDRGGIPSSVDISPVVSGAVVPLYILADWLAKERSVDVADIMAELREQLDALWGD